MVDNIKTPMNTDAELAERLKVRFDDYRRLMTYYSCAMMEMETKFKVLNSQFSLSREYNPIETIKTRLKSPESIQEKLQRRGASFDVASVERTIYDIAGVRVICPFVDDIYLLVDCLLSQDDVKLIEKKRLYRTSEGERIPQSSFDRRDTNLSVQRKANDESGSAVQNDCDGFLGKSGTSDKI